MRISSINSENPVLDDGVVYLARLKSSDVGTDYVNWLNNPTVNEYLECRHEVHTVESVKQYVGQLEGSTSDQLLFGIFLTETKKQIGTIKLGPINLIHMHASIGIMIGEKMAWGKGYGTRSICLLSEYAFKELGLESLNAGCYSENIGSCKAFIKSGWEVTGHIKSHRLNKLGNRTDELMLSVS